MYLVSTRTSPPSSVPVDCLMHDVVYACRKTAILPRQLQRHSSDSGKIIMGDKQGIFAGSTVQCFLLQENAVGHRYCRKTLNPHTVAVYPSFDKGFGFEAVRVGYVDLTLRWAHYEHINPLLINRQSKEYLTRFV